MSDMIVLVVAANEGITPYSLDIIQWIKEFNLPYIVALNKMDLATKYEVERVKQQLKGYKLNSKVLQLCALLPNTIDPLLSEINKIIQPKLCDHDSSPEGTVLDSIQMPGVDYKMRTFIRRGTIRRNESFLVGYRTGKIKQLLDTKGEQIECGTPGQVVDIIGLKRKEKRMKNVIPPIGDTLFCLEPSRIDEILEHRFLSAQFENAIEKDKETENTEDMKNIVICASDTAMLSSLIDTIGNVNICRTSIGPVQTGDVNVAIQCNATLLALNVTIPQKEYRSIKNAGIKMYNSRLVHKIVELFNSQKQQM